MGFDPATGTVILAGTKTYKSNINYIIDGATVTPFGISTGSTSNSITAGFVEVNAPVTVNSTVVLTNHLGVNGKITLRVLDTVHILSGAVINGTTQCDKLYCYRWLIALRASKALCITRECLQLPQFLLVLLQTICL